MVLVSLSSCEKVRAQDSKIVSIQQAKQLLQKDPGSVEESLYLFDKLPYEDYINFVRSLHSEKLGQLNLSQFYIVYQNNKELIIRKHLYGMNNYDKDNFICTTEDVRQCNNHSTFYIDTTKGTYLFLSDLSNIFDGGFSSVCPEFSKLEGQYLTIQNSDHCGGTMDDTEDYYHVYQVKNNGTNKYAVYKYTDVVPTSFSFFNLFLTGAVLALFSVTFIFSLVIKGIIKKDYNYRMLLISFLILILALTFLTLQWWGPKVISHRIVEEPCPACGG